MLPNRGVSPWYSFSTGVARRHRTGTTVRVLNRDEYEWSPLLHCTGTMEERNAARALTVVRFQNSYNYVPVLTSSLRTTFLLPALILKRRTGVRILQKKSKSIDATGNAHFVIHNKSLLSTS